MSSNYFYSPSTCGFYNSSDKEEFVNSSAGWPEDAQPLSEEEYLSLLSGQESGGIICAGENGKPYVAEPDINWTVAALTKKSSLLSAAAEITSDWKTELQLNIISDDDKEKLSDWMLYIKELKATDISDVESKDIYEHINWPEAPSL